MPEAYEEWQQLLADEFLLPRVGPTVLFLDDTELGRICPMTDPARHLSAAVREKLDIAASGHMFRPVTAAHQRWRRGDQHEPPPVLPVLAVSVLAAARMRSDADARSTNYYLRLAQALMPDEDEATIQTVRAELRDGAFLDVVQMWRDLDEWIEAKPGFVGTSTIRDHPRLRRIGYPLSQALVRHSDRAALTRFFQALELTPDDTPDASVILSSLDIWTATAHNRLSETFMGALSDSEARPLLGSVVHAHAQAWDGRVLTSDGKQRIAVKLGIDLEAWNTRWLFPVISAAPETVILSGVHTQDTVILAQASGRDYYVVQGAPPVTSEMMASGFRLRGAEFTAEFTAAPIVFLCLDQQTGAWSSVPEMLPFEEHLVAVASPHVADFRRVLESAASAGWRLMPQRGAALLPGYALFEKVRFSNGKALETALARVPGLRGLGVAPAVIPRARLIHGLPIATSISTSHYLMGGEPDLLLPSGPNLRMVPVTLDGLRSEVPANGFPLELRRFVGREAGRHSIDADGKLLGFTSLEEGPNLATPPGTGTLGWTSSGKLSDSRQPLAVIGALVTVLSNTRHILARRGRDESWLLHDDGRTEKVAEPSRPAFLATSGIELHLPRFELAVPASARWLAQRRGSRWRLTKIGPPSSSEYDVEIDVLGLWKRACSDANIARLWDLQLRMAGEHA